MAFIIGLYLVVDLVQHQGQARVLLPKQFPELRGINCKPAGKSLINSNKNWKKGINTIEKLEELDNTVGGFECDVYFDTVTKLFSVHHDPGKSTGLTLNDLLQRYQEMHLTASIWLDIKNLDDTNSDSALQSLIQLRTAYALVNKILVESGKANLLTVFSDSGFFCSYYVPFFNPYKEKDDVTASWADSISSVISKARVDALSGYYFQSRFLHHYFPGYSVLTWIDDPSWSLVNLLFQRKIRFEKSIFIVLKP